MSMTAAPMHEAEMLVRVLCSLHGQRCLWGSAGGGGTQMHAIPMETLQYPYRLAPLRGFRSRSTGRTVWKLTPCRAPVGLAFSADV